MKRRRADGSDDSILAYARRRGKWPSSGNRWCTSDFKRGPIGRLFTSLGEGLILNCLGMRAQESPSRAKLPEFEENKRYTTASRCVDNWLPIHSWTLEQVWARIKASGVPHHYAYDLGMPRLSCCFCIFSPKPALLLAGKHNPELLAEYVATETAINHSFRNGFKIAEIKAALDAGEQPGRVQDWVM
jgi:3'-phosphoadenosine 5'-phosphosulfate sulfotransferase (PAPS reductase)/FAD synthetase